MIPLRQRTLNRICWKMQESSGAWDAFSTVPGSSAPFSKFERQMSIHPYFFHAQLRAWANRLACFSAALWHQEFNTRSLDPIVYFFTVGWDLDTKEIAQLHRISNFHNLPRSSWITDAIWCHIPAAFARGDRRSSTETPCRMDLSSSGTSCAAQLPGGNQKKELMRACAKIVMSNGSTKSG